MVLITRPRRQRQQPSCSMVRKWPESATVWLQTRARCQRLCLSLASGTHSMIDCILSCGSLFGGLVVWLLGIRPYLSRHGGVVVTGATWGVSAWADWQQCSEFARAKHDSRAAALSKTFLACQIGFVAGIVLMICGCRNTQPRASVTQYGQSGPGKIAILIVGGVEKPGRYYVDQGATLESVSGLFGGFRACETCGFTPSRVIVSHEGNAEETRGYSLSRTNEWRPVTLRDGDRVSHATIHF
jgi:hypothetical protein